MFETKKMEMISVSKHLVQMFAKCERRKLFFNVGSQNGIFVLRNLSSRLEKIMDVRSTCLHYIQDYREFSAQRTKHSRLSIFRYDLHAISIAISRQKFMANNIIRNSFSIDYLDYHVLLVRECSQFSYIFHFVSCEIINLISNQMAFTFVSYDTIQYVKLIILVEFPWKFLWMKTFEARLSRKSWIMLEVHLCCEQKCTVTQSGE